ncbi:hypothetical protein H1R20_g1812, partial [Candolleomyces eurysporus]
MLDGRLVTLIDTPDFNDTTRGDTDILKMIARVLASTYQKRKTLAGVILVHRNTDDRFSGLSTRYFKMFREQCGDSSLKNVVILTNMWNEAGERAGAEEELATRDIFEPVLDKGVRTMRHNGSRKSALKVIRSLLNSDTGIVPQFVREISIEKKASMQAKDEETRREIEERSNKLRVDMNRVEEESKKAASGFRKEKANSSGV